MLIADIAVIDSVLRAARRAQEQIAVFFVTCFAPWVVYTFATIMTMMFVVAFGIGSLRTIATVITEPSLQFIKYFHENISCLIWSAIK